MAKPIVRDLIYHGVGSMRDHRAVRPLVHHLPIGLSGPRGDDGRARHCRVAHDYSSLGDSLCAGVREAMNRFARPVNTSWCVDETYIHIRGEFSYLYRAVDKHGKTVDFLLRPDRDIAAAQAFFRKALSTSMPRWARKILTLNNRRRANW